MIISSYLVEKVDIRSLKREKTEPVGPRALENYCRKTAGGRRGF